MNGVTRCLDNLTENLPKDIELTIVSTDDFLSVPFLGYKEIRLSLAFPRQISRKISEIQPDFIHIVTEWPIGLTAALICQKKKITYTTSFHTKFPEYLSMRNRLLREEYVHWYLHIIHWWAEKILISNTGLEKYLTRNGYTKFGVVPLGINHDFFYPGEKTLFIEKKRPILLYVGRVAIEKNIKAFLEIDENYTKIVVGDWPLLDDLKEEYPNVFFLGIRKGNELWDIYRSADIFVFPSKTDTLGLVNLEAMACWLPVLAYDIENTRAIIQNGETGILVPDGHRLDEWICQTSKIDRNGCIEYARRFTWQEYVRKFLENQIPIPKDTWI